MVPWFGPSEETTLEVTVSQSVVDRLDALGAAEGMDAAEITAQAAKNACSPLMSPRAMGAYGLGCFEAMTIQVSDGDAGVRLTTLAEELDVSLPADASNCVFAERAADAVRSMLPAEAREVVDAAAAVATSEETPAEDPTRPHMDRISNVEMPSGYARAGDHRLFWGWASEDPFEEGAAEFVFVSAVLRRTPSYWWLAPGREPLDIVPVDEPEHMATIADAVAAFDAGDCDADETLAKLEPIEQQVLGPSGADPDSLLEYLLADPVYYPLVAVLWSTIGYVHRDGPATEPENEGDVDRTMADHLREARDAAGDEFRGTVLDNVAMAGTFVIDGDSLADGTVEGDHDLLEPWLAGLRRFEHLRAANGEDDGDGDDSGEADRQTTTADAESDSTVRDDTPNAAPGRLAIARFDGTVELYDSETFERERTIDAHSTRGPTNAVAWHPDGGRVLTAGWDCTVKLWDPDADDPLVTAHDDLGGQEINTVAWHPAGTHYAFGGWSVPVQVWAVDGEEPLWTFDHDDARVAAVAFHPQEELFATVSHDTSVPTVILWDLTTGERVRERPDDAISGGEPLAWTPAGDRLAIGGTNSVQVLDGQLDEHLATLNDKSGRVEALAWAPDGERLAVGTRSLSIWDVSSRSRDRFRISAWDSILDNPGLAWNPAGTEVVIAGADGTLMRVTAEDGEIRTTGKAAREHPGDRRRGKTELQDIAWEWRERT